MIKLKLLMGVGVALLFVGCTGNTPKPLHQQQRVVKNIGTHYYHVPAYADGFKLNKKYAYLNRVVSSGLLECKTNYAFIQTSNAKDKIGKATTEYYASLSPAELIQIRKHPTAIPRRNEKEFQKIIQVETKAVRGGEAYCIAPMSQKQVRQYQAYQAQQAKINNDPRVIAARTNQQAAMMNYQAATATKNVNYNVNHSGFVNYSGSMYHY